MIKQIFEVKHTVCIDPIEMKLYTILSNVCEKMGLLPYEVKSNKRHTELVHARAIFCQRATKDEINQKRIADYINRERSMVSHYIHKYDPPKHLEDIK